VNDRRSPLSGRSATLLMVDDEPTTIDVIEMFLQAEGYERLIPITDSRRALGAIAEERPDVVLLDLNMPEVGGLDILRAMRADEALAHVPVIILTSSADADTKLRALELGANDFLAKPVDPSELVLRLRNTLAAKAYQDQLEYYDRLTGLPNRRLFTERLGQALGSARRAEAHCAVLYIALDRFRHINDTLGRAVGDTLLSAAAGRIAKCVEDGAPPAAASGKPGRILSRVGGDEFAWLLSGCGSVEDAEQVARRLLSRLQDPFGLDGRELFTSFSIGIAFFPDDADNAEALLANAGIAMSHASRGGGNAVQFYNASLNARSAERLNLESQLRRALDRDEISLHYQPKVDIGTGRIIGAEALMRWRHPQMGSVPPNHFIPIAEESGLIASLGEWAIWCACRQGRIWHDAGLPLPISVNLSAKQFHAGGIEETIRNALQGSGLEGRWLVLELTESMIMENFHESSDVLRALKDMGVEVSVDDFGTGYSSLSYLKRFPLDELKIDRSFVKGVPQDADDAAIVTAIIGMAHSLGLKVVAEGVETEEQLAFLRDRGCDEYQGFLCSKPVVAADWSRLLQEHSNGAGVRGSG
jgi:diguanylate cyclase (GGDEF)-like protein